MFSSWMWAPPSAASTQRHHQERERALESRRKQGGAGSAGLGWPMVGGGPVFVVRRVLTEICMVMMIEEKKKGACTERERESRRNVAGNAILKHITQTTHHSEQERILLGCLPAPFRFKYLCATVRA